MQVFQKFLTKQLFAKNCLVLLNIAIAHSIAFFSVDPRVVLDTGYMAEFKFHISIYNSGRRELLCLFSLLIKGREAYLISIPKSVSPCPFEV